MASYATDPRTGLLIVTQDDGTQLPGMMPEMAPQFDAMGMTRATDSGPAARPSDGGGGAGLLPPSMRYAGPGATAAGTLPPPADGGMSRPRDEPLMSGAGDQIIEPFDIPPTSQLPPSMRYTGPGATDEGQLPGRTMKGDTGHQGPVSLVPEQTSGVGGPSAKEGAQATDVPLSGEGGSSQSRGGGGGPARYVDVPLSPLRTTSRQVTHDRRDALTDEERAQRQIPLAEQQQRLGFAERRDKLNRDTALLNDEKAYYAQKNQLQKEESRQKEINKRTRLLQIERDNLDKEAREASVDPKRYFRDMSIWTKIVAAVSAGLQGYQGGMTGQGGMPPVIGLLQDLNKQDIEDQKLKMESAVARGKLANDRYEQAVKLWGDPDAAEMQMERDKLALVDGWLARQAAAQQADAAASEAFATARQQIQERRIALDDELSLWGRAEIVDQMQATPKRMVGGGGGGGGGGASNKLRQRMVRMPDGSYKFAQDEKGAENARKFMLATQTSQRLAKEIIALRQESGAWERAVGTGKGAQLEAKVNQLRLNEKNRFELGQLTGSDVEMMPVPDAHELFESGVDETLNTAIQDSTVQAGDYAAQYLSDDPAGTLLPSGGGVAGERR
jgi:hypothetical protein